LFVEAADEEGTVNKLLSSGLVLGLGACSAGGGGTGSAGAAAVDPQTKAASVSPFVYNLQGGGSITRNPDGTATVTTGAGTFVVSAAAIPSTFGGAMMAHQSGTTPDFTLETMDQMAGLSASTFGVWNTVDAAGTPTATRFFAGGQATAPALLPPQGSNVTATYNGSYIANLQSPASYAGATIPAGPFGGSAQINVDFGAGAVQAKLGGRLADTFPTTSSLNRSTGSYSAAGGTFSPYAAATYSLNGAFYGTPAAGQAPPETAGTLSGTIGPTTPTQAAAIFTGSFGAHR
jgi:hypothetical protein